MINIKECFDNKIAELETHFLNFPWENKELVCKWLNQKYYLTQNSTRYLALSASLVKLEDSQEFKWWAHHLEEEMDHDKTILKDLKNLGYTKQAPIMPETRALIASQYYDIQKNGADALLGYSLLLEGLSCKLCSVLGEKIQKFHGVKSIYLHLHAEVDQGHYAEGVKRIENLSEERKQIILDNLEMMASLYVSFLRATQVETRGNEVAA